MSYEVNTKTTKERAHEKRTIAFQVEDDEEIDENIVFSIRNYKEFRKFKKGQKFSNNGNTTLKCYECNKTGHIKKDSSKLIKKPGASRMRVYNCPD